MVEPETKPEDKVDLKLGEKTPVDTKPKDTTKPTQEDLNWREKLPDDLKGNESLQKFKTLNEFSTAYLNLQKKLGDNSLYSLQDKHDSETAKKTLESLFPEQKYSDDVDPDFAKIAEEHKVPALLGQEIDKKFKEVKEKKFKAEREAKIHQYKKDLKDADSDNNLERLLGVGLQKLGMSFVEYKDLFKDEHLNPKVVEKIAGVGKSTMSDEHIDITAGGTGGLTSDPDDLKSMISNLSRQKITAVSASDRIAIETELTKVKAKLNKVMENKPKGMF